MKAQKKVLFVYLDPELKTKVNQLSRSSNTYVSTVVSKIIEAYFTNTKPNFNNGKKREIPQYVLKAEAWKAKNT